jgi:hypothetical protein
MSIDNQIEPPQSFMAMYMTPGRDRPNAPQDVVLARYEQCEDIATILAEQAQTLAGVSEFLCKRDLITAEGCAPRTGW